MPNSYKTYKALAKDPVLIVEAAILGGARFLSRLRRSAADSPTPNETQPAQVEVPQMHMTLNPKTLWVIL